MCARDLVAVFSHFCVTGNHALELVWTSFVFLFIRDVWIQFCFVFGDDFIGYRFAPWFAVSSGHVLLTFRSSSVVVVLG